MLNFNLTVLKLNCEDGVFIKIHCWEKWLEGKCLMIFNIIVWRNTKLWAKSTIKGFFSVTIRLHLNLLQWRITLKEVPKHQESMIAGRMKIFKGKNIGYYESWHNVNFSKKRRVTYVGTKTILKMRNAKIAKQNN